VQLTTAACSLARLVDTAIKPVYAQLRTPADDVALPAFAAAPLLLTAGRAAVDRYLLAAGPTAANPQQRRATAGWDRQTDRRMDARPTTGCAVAPALC